MIIIYVVVPVKMQPCTVQIQNTEQYFLISVSSTEYIQDYLNLHVLLLVEKKLHQMFDFLKQPTFLIPPFWQLQPRFSHVKACSVPHMAIERHLSTHLAPAAGPEGTGVFSRSDLSHIYHSHVDGTDNQNKFNQLQSPMFRQLGISPYSQ